MKPIAAKDYRIAPELRRCCWYAILGVAAIVGVTYWVTRFVNRDPVTLAISCAAMAFLEISMVLTLRWRLRIDPEGIKRRRFFIWDSWTWSQLASGGIHKLHAYALRDSDRAWWRRTLCLDYMASGDVQEVMRELNAHYQLPAPPEVPEKLTIKHAFRSLVTFDRSGIRLVVRGAAHKYEWRDVRHVRITRMDPLRRDFSSLEIGLADQDVHLLPATWQGPGPDVVNEFLTLNVSPEKFDTSSETEPLKKRWHIERKLRQTKERNRGMARCMAFTLPLLIGALTWVAIDRGTYSAMPLAVLSALVVWAGIVAYRSGHQKIREWKSLLTPVADEVYTRTNGE